MNDLIVFLLPPAVALTGMRLNYFLLGREHAVRLGFGLRFALGLAVGMLVFSQAVLLGTLAGVNLASELAWIVLIWGLAEVFWLVPKVVAGLKNIQFNWNHLWLLILLPVIYYCWVFGRLSTVEETVEFDALAFWVFKAKILFWEQGHHFLSYMHRPDFSYVHWDYPMLIPCLYALNYGAVGTVNEFVDTVWPFWMMVSLCLAVLSIGKAWKQPHPLPLVTILVLCFLPASLQFIRFEGGTIPMVFYVSLTTLLTLQAISHTDEIYCSAAILVAAGCAMTKLEGAIYAVIWLCLLFPICRRHNWLKKSIIWKNVLIAVICLLPYVWFRLEKPAPHPMSGWWHNALASPASVLHNFLLVWFLGMGSRFFNSHFFQWQLSGDNQLQWIGNWSGLNSFVNEDLSFLPWLLAGLLVLSLWKGSNRSAIINLAAVMTGVLTFLSLIIACLPHVLTDQPSIIGYDVARYYYPFFVAWFLGVTAVWFENVRRSTGSDGSEYYRRKSASGRIPPVRVVKNKTKQIS